MRVSVSSMSMSDAARSTTVLNNSLELVTLALVFMPRAGRAADLAIGAQHVRRLGRGLGAGLGQRADHLDHHAHPLSGVEVHRPSARDGR